MIGDGTMFACYPVASLPLHECLYSDNVGQTAAIVSKAQCLRNELCTQRENAECGLARSYHDALTECVENHSDSAHARAHILAKWCIGKDWIVTMSGVRAEQSLALLASVYACLAAPKNATPTEFAHALDSLKRLNECLLGWANFPRKSPLFDFEVSHLNALRIYCHAAMNVHACADIETKNEDGSVNTEALIVKAQFARHAYELLAPIVASAQSSAPRARAVRDACIALHRDAVAHCFLAAATVEKERETYDAALRILKKGARLLGPEASQHTRDVDVLTRNISDLKMVFSPHVPDATSSTTFDWSMIPHVECVLPACTCEAHSEAYARGVHRVT